ncbi:MAG: selenide, water dikinase SelD [Nitrosomonas sp.]|nr:MAG: selenide, water dikinase SelD [Nitrosomonas sp.]
MIGLAQQNKDLRLIGGGHSHITVIRRLAMKPLPRTRVTLISNETMTPYSGMLPGLIAGHYTFGDCHIDLRKLCQWADVQFIRSTVIHIDPLAKRIVCRNYPALRYDLLSIDCGSQPALSGIVGAEAFGVPVKPVAQFLQHWRQWLSQAQTAAQTQRIVVVGAGAAGIEILLALRYQLLSTTAIQAEFILICAEPLPLGTHNKRMRNFFLQHLQTLGVRLICGKRVIAASDRQLILDDQSRVDADFIAWAIHAGAQLWPKASGLACDEHGFIAVDRYLRSISHADVFAAGDCAAFTPHPLPKAGIYAVRQGPILADNLIAQLKNRSLRPFKPQRLFLSLLTTGDRYAAASRGAFFANGKWVWYWKNFIDRRFMARFVPKSMAASDKSVEASESMRCGGCGAKIGSGILHNVLTQLKILPCPDIVSGLGDDAAIIHLPANTQWLQSVDFFRAFIDDPYLLGRIAAIHSLGDIYAMGGTPHSALATAIIPYGSEAIMQEKLLHLMQGIVAALNQEHTALIGGHSGEGPEIAVGLTVNGTLTAGAAFTKVGLQPGDSLILTKPVGSGVLLAANMSAQCQGDWLDHAVEWMLQSNRNAAAILRAHNIRSCTDVTGFGLLGHLQEMLLASRCGATVSLDAVPVMDGAQHCSAQGIRSTLYPHNRKASRCQTYQGSHPSYPLLFDPQTAGGLLAGVPAMQVRSCLQQLCAAGYSAACIGSVTAPDSPIVLS